MKWIGTIVLLIITTALVAQPSFQKTYGETDFYDRGNSVRQTPDSGYIVAGRTVNFGSGGGVNASLLRVDKNGKQLWNKSFGGSGSEEAFSVDITSDGGFVLGGYTNSLGEGAADFYLLKTNGKGKEQWEKTFGGSGIERAYSVIETTDEGFAIVGETYSFGEGWVNAYMVKTDSKGDTMWTQVYGGNGIEEAHCVDQTRDKGYVLTGATNSFGAGDYDIYLIRTDARGEKLWSKTFGGTGSEKGEHVQECADGGYIITGHTTSYGAGGVDIILIKTDKNGEELWRKTYGGSTDDFGRSVTQVHDGGFIIAGNTNSDGNGGMDMMLVKTGPEGEEDWRKYYGSEGDDFGHEAIQTMDAGYVVAGSTVRQGGAETTEKVKDIFLVKTNQKGN